MPLKVVIPAPLRKFTAGAETVEVQAATVQEVLDNLDSKYPGFRTSVCDESGALRRFINIYRHRTRDLGRVGYSAPSSANGPLG